MTSIYTFPDNLIPARDAKRPITGKGPQYCNRNTERFQRLLHDQQQEINRLKRKRKKLKLKYKKLEETLAKQKEKIRINVERGLPINPKDRDYIKQLEMTIVSALSAVRKNRNDINSVSNGNQIKRE